MHASAIVLGLAATVSAIDMYGYRSNEQCKGNDFTFHANVNPGDCAVYASGNIYRSIGWRAIPTDWRINGNAYTGTGCGNIRYTASSNGAQNICAGGWNYSGGKYEFAGKKRAAAPDAGTAAAEGCQRIHRSDAIVFADGTRYNLTSLDDADHAEMVCTSCYRTSPQSAPS